MRSRSQAGAEGGHGAAAPATAQLIGESRATARLALPLVAGQVSQMLMGLTDTLMIGRLGVVPLAASTFANNVLHVPLMFGIGMSIAVSIRVSQARGAGDRAAARAALRHGLQLSVVAGLATFLGALALVPFLDVFRQTGEVVATVPAYFLLVAFSMIPANGAMAVKNHADAMNRPWPAFWIMLGGVALNVALNWILIYGRLGAPRLELEGAGLGTLLARLATLAGLIAWCVRDRALRGWVPIRWLRAPDWRAVRELVGLGLPASLQLLAEVGAFVVATLVIGSLGAAALASHQVAMSCAATVFMVPLGVSMALTVRTGEAWGAGQPHRLRVIVLGGWLMVAGFTLASASAFVAFNGTIAGWFLTEPEARKVAAGLLLVAAAFQFSDAVQIASAGALRGLGDVKVPAWLAFGIYWGIALPAGWFLTFHSGLGVRGMWWGITLGLTLTALTLGIRIWRMSAGVPPHRVG